ncbi:hypothetical protein [Nocardiopsis baichengensis]|uniref:hypothetical protein n=1 Tax=Nocardiopsis baichengensis TaxID=280240 RepID=UPI000363DBA8|nr:hypothetical protein [Nocardiopsis baichengensis]
MCRRSYPLQSVRFAASDGPPQGARLRSALAIAAFLAVLALTALDALVTAAAGTRPLTLSVRAFLRWLADAYERAAHPEVIDAEVIDEEEVRR